jgi:hypothetical protein
VRLETSDAQTVGAPGRPGRISEDGTNTHELTRDFLVNAFPKRKNVRDSPNRVMFITLIILYDGSFWTTPSRTLVLVIYHGLYQVQEMGAAALCCLPVRMLGSCSTNCNMQEGESCACARVWVGEVGGVGRRTLKN